MAYIPNSGSVVAFQSDPTKLVATVSVVGAVTIGNTSILAVPTGNQSVSGNVGVTQQSTWIASVFGNVSVLGTVPVTQSGTWVQSIVSTVPSSVLVGSSIFGQLPGGTAVLGSVAALQATNPWNVAGSVAAFVVGNSSVITVAQSSVAVAIVSGSIAATFTPPANQSVSGTVGVNQLGTWSTSVMTNTITSIATAGAVMGSVAALQATNPWVVSGTVGSSIIGQLPAGTAMLGSVVAYQGAIPWTINSVYGNISGSVAATITNTNVNVSGSVVAFQGTAPWVIQSIVGTYSEDQASTSADKGLLAFGVRNDTVASLVGSDSDYGAWSQDSAGRHLVKPFVSEDGIIISYVGSVVSGSVTLIQASVIGKKSYITDFIISNTGSANTLVTFQGGDTSLIGQYIAPTGGGMVATGLNLPLKNTASQDLAFKVSPSSSILYLTIKGYVAP